MSIRDRTNEFQSIVGMLLKKDARTLDKATTNGQLQRPNPAITTTSKLISKQKAAAHYREFALAARQIGRDLAHTLAKLEKLTLLTRDTSQFQSGSNEIERLLEIIRQDTAQLNHQIGTLQQISRRNTRYVSNDAVDQMTRHSSSVVMGLQTRLAKISTEFKGVLEERTESLKQQSDRRREQFGDTSFSLPNSEFAINPENSILVSEAAGLLAPYPGTTDDSSSAARKRFPQQQQQQLQLIPDHSYLEERATAVGNIESTIVELGSIFSQLTTMVQEQGELVTRIDTSVEEAESNVEAAHDELLKYFHSLTSSRWFALKVFAVLFIFFVLFIVVI